MKLKEILPTSPCEFPTQDKKGETKVGLARMSIHLITTIGGWDLCAWQPVRGVVWVQTRNPQHARRLAQREDGRLVAWGVAGGYLKAFEFARTITWAIDLMARYTAAEKATNEALGRAICPRTNPKTGKEMEES